jgi:hypothetical protein
VSGAKLPSRRPKARRGFARGKQKDDSDHGLAVAETLRVVLASNWTPNRFSKPRMEWLSADCEIPSRAAERVKLRSSATVANAESSPKSFLMIYAFYS